MRIELDYQEETVEEDRLAPEDLATLHDLASALGRPDLALGLVLVGEGEITRLNEAYRGVSKPTDVLSFEYGAEQRGSAAAEDRLAGEVYVSAPAARRQARERGHSYALEVARLFLHGALHVLGYDHETREEAAAMRREEERLLAALGARRKIDPVTLL
jgi:probable rRNA maturation factor